MIKKFFTAFTILFLSMITLAEVHAKQKETKVIAFDFGGVIGTTNQAETIKFIVDSLHISKKEVKNILKTMKKQGINGQNEEEFWEIYSKKKKITLPANWFEKLNDVKLKSVEENPGMLNLVENLKKEGYQTALLSNVCENKAALYHEVGVYNLFEPRILSHEIGVKKPELEAYVILLNALQISPQEVLFVDNKHCNVDAAKDLGMDGIVFTSRNQLIKELKQKNIRISTR